MSASPSPPSVSPTFLSTELANSITHGVGVICSIAGLVVLVVLASARGEAIHVVACSVYGATLILLYTASTLYHSLWSNRARNVLRIIDHAAIFLLIAGTYTPFALISLRGAWGWSIFGVIWTLAVLGILFKIMYIGRNQILSVFIYIAMGWLVVVVIKPLLAVIPAEGVYWLVAGGLAYTVGTIFFAWHTLPFHHAIWHLFVMTGSTCHFFAIMLYVIPRGA